MVVSELLVAKVNRLPTGTEDEVSPVTASVVPVLLLPLTKGVPVTVVVKLLT